MEIFGDTEMEIAAPMLIEKPTGISFASSAVCVAGQGWGNTRPMPVLSMTCHPNGVLAGDKQRIQ